MRPIFFWLGPVPVTAFGFLSALGTLLGYWFSHLQARDEKLDHEVFIDSFLLVLIAGMLGSRVLYVLTYPETVAGDPWAFLKIYSGGLTLYGGFMAASLTGIVYARIKGIPVLDYLDLVFPYAVLGHLFGRLGCFGNGCCYGASTGGEWGWVFPLTDPSLTPRHATQVYEAVGLGVILLVLNRMRLRRLYGGRIVAVYLAMYAVLRFAVEFLRADTAAESYLFGTTLAQSTALLMLPVAGLVWFLRLPLPRPLLGVHVPAEGAEFTAGERGVAPEAGEMSGR